MKTLTELREFYIESVNEETRKKIQHFRAHRLRGFQYLAHRLLFGSNLKALGLINATDKATVHEQYLEHYTEHFARMRRRRLNLLEIGIGGYDDPEAGGGSLRMWRTYFPRAHIFGIDIADKSSHDEKRIKTFRGSQVDESFLAGVLEQTGPLDIIIDDGSHVCEHVIKSFEFLFPRMKEPGIYVIEDTLTSYWEGGCSASDNGLNRPHTTMSYFKSLVDGLNYREQEGRVPTYLDQHILEITFYHNMIFIKKGLN
jgi:demethylmacrocin O-methyltransferase